MLFFLTIYVIDKFKVGADYSESLQRQQIYANVIKKYPKLDGFLKLALVEIIKAPFIFSFEYLTWELAYILYFFSQLFGLYITALILERRAKAFTQQHEQLLFLFPLIFLSLVALVGLVQIYIATILFY